MTILQTGENQASKTEKKCRSGKPEEKSVVFWDPQIGKKQLHHYQTYEIIEAQMHYQVCIIITPCLHSTSLKVLKLRWKSTLWELRPWWFWIIFDLHQEVLQPEFFFGKIDTLLFMGSWWHPDISKYTKCCVLGVMQSGVWYFSDLGFITEIVWNIKRSPYLVTCQSHGNATNKSRGNAISSVQKTKSLRTIWPSEYLKLWVAEAGNASSQITWDITCY